MNIRLRNPIVIEKSNNSGATADMTPSGKSTCRLKIPDCFTKDVCELLDKHVRPDKYWKSNMDRLAFWVRMKEMFPEIDGLDTNIGVWTTSCNGPVSFYLEWYE